MEDGYRLIDYSINVNDVVQLMIRAAPLPATKEGGEKNSEEESADEQKENKPKGAKSVDESLVDATCEYYEVNLI